MNDRLAFQNAREAKHETHHSPFRKRADQYRSNFFLRLQRERRIYFEVFNSPDLTLKLFDFAHLREGLDVSNGDSGSQMSRPAINSFSQFTSIGLVTYASKPLAFASERKS